MTIFLRIKIKEKTPNISGVNLELAIQDPNSSLYALLIDYQFPCALGPAAFSRLQGLHKYHDLPLAAAERTPLE